MLLQKKILLLFLALALIPMTIVGVAELVTLEYLIHDVLTRTHAHKAHKESLLAEWASHSLMRNGILWLMVAAIVSAMAIFLAKTITRPLALLTRAFDDLAQGKMVAPPPQIKGRDGKDGRDDEWAQLGRSFTLMLGRMKTHMELLANLELAREVQQSLLPRDTYQDRHFDIGGCARFCDQAGGDYYDILPYSTRKDTDYLLVMADVAGHGMAASLIMAVVSAHIRALYQSCDLPQLMQSLNDHLCATLSDGYFVTLALVRLRKKRVQLCWAGHPPAFVYRQKAGRIDEAGAGGIIAGAVAGQTYHTQEIQALSKGDMLVLLTDGLLEAQNDEGALWGARAIKQTLKELKDKEAREISQQLIDRASQFSAHINDDMTTLTVKAL